MPLPGKVFMDISLLAKRLLQVRKLRKGLSTLCHGSSGQDYCLELLLGAKLLVTKPFENMYVFVVFNWSHDDFRLSSLPALIFRRNEWHNRLYLAPFLNQLTLVGASYFNPFPPFFFKFVNQPG